MEWASNKISDYQNRDECIKAAEFDERQFCEEAKKYKKYFKTNPEKLYNKYALDLIIIDGKNTKCDLKGQYCPFFKSEVIVNIKPNFFHRITVDQFDKYVKDLEKNNIDTVLIFYSNWEKQSKYGIEVPYVNSCYITTIYKLQKATLKLRCPISRKNDNRGNDKEYYSLDLSDSDLFTNLWRE